jgi:hypothetical protein
VLAGWALRHLLLETTRTLVALAAAVLQAQFVTPSIACFHRLADLCCVRPCAAFRPAVEQITPYDMEAMYGCLAVGGLQYPDHLRQRCREVHGHEPLCVIAVGRKDF